MFVARDSRPLWGVFVALVCVVQVAAAEGKRLAFDIPSGAARPALRQFAAQGKREIVFPVESVDGVKTQTVKGEMTAGEALAKMLAGTILTATEDERTGAFAILRRDDAPPEKARALPAPQGTPISASPQKKKTMKTNASFLVRLVAGLIVQPLSAAEPDSLAPSKADEPLLLSTFQVSTSLDKGYLAANSLVGGRMNTDLIKTPSDVTVLTKDFMTDLGATSYFDTIRYMTSATMTGPITSNDQMSRISFRGMPAGLNFRNYFRGLLPIDGYIVERMETVRGANALLFGDGSVGGALNTVTKSARFGQNFSEVQARFDSEGSTRVIADFNRSSQGSYAIRLNLLADKERSWVDRYYKERLGAHVAATYSPWRSGQLKIELEQSTIETNFAPASAFDNASSYNGTYAVTGPLAATPVGVGVNRIATDTLILDPANNVGVQNWVNLGVTAGTGLALSRRDRAGIASFPVINRNFSVQPRNAVGDIRYYLVGTSFQQSWGNNLVGEIAAQYSNNARDSRTPTFNSYRIDVNQVLPSGSPNPKFGKVYSDAVLRPSQSDLQNQDFRANVGYVLPTNRWKQRLNAGVIWRREIWYVLTEAYGRNNNPRNPLIAATENELQYRVYWDEPQTKLREPVSNGTYTWEYVPVRDMRAGHTLTSGQVATVAEFWEDRLTFIGGIRRDRFSQFQDNINVATNDLAGRPSSKSSVPTKSSVTTSSAGFVLFPVHEAGLYVNYSESFNGPTAGVGLYGENPGPTNSYAKSGGLRFRLLGDSIVGSVGYYKIKEAGRVNSYASAEINRIWVNLNKGEKQTGAGTYLDTLDYVGSGYELDLVANLTRNFRFRGNLAFPETSQTNTIPSLRSYYAANIQEWNNAAANPNVTERAQVAADIAVLSTRIANSNEGRAINLTPDYTASVFGMYTIPAGSFRNARVGGGITWQGAAIVGNEVGRPFDYVKRDPFTDVSLSLGYSFRIGNTPADVQLNITNLMKDNDPVYTSTTTFSGSTLRNDFYYNEPRKAALTLTVKF